jgi:serine/threonine-protein kinase
VEEAVVLASKVSGALQHAHEYGVIHRDIKPANILLQDGEPVVSDFGIALALGVVGGTRLTETGLRVDTPYYMSPEQATGDQAVGASTDTYALGSVLYEMLVGDPPFARSTAQAVLGKIIAGKSVSVREERPSVPANVDAAVRKALEKLPADRFSSEQEFAKALGDEHFRYGELETAGTDGATAGPWKQLTMAFTGLASPFAVAFGWSLLCPDPPGLVTRVSVRIPEERLFHPNGGDLDLSPDGALMVYRGADEEGRPILWAKRWNALDATVIRGTEGAGLPTISPDGQEVAFHVGGSMRVAPIQGGVSRTLVEGGFCCTGWSSDGARVYFSDADVGLRRVPARGGSPEIVTEVDIGAGDRLHVLRDVLPGGGGVVFMTRGPGGDRVQAVDVETGEVKDLTPGTYHATAPRGICCS